MRKKYLLGISLFILLMSMTCISASENVNQTDNLGVSIEDNFETAENDQKIIRSTNNEDELKENKNQTMNSNILAISNEDEILGANDIYVKGDTFESISDAIQSAQAGDTIHLNGTYTNNWKKHIEIDREISIIGKDNATLDAQGFSRIFYVTSGKINIQNVVFKNGNADNGGAIYFENTISNSNINATFINNTAREGGANYFKWHIENSNISGTYTNNTAGVAGGANYFMGHLRENTITGTYTSNKATAQGGVNFFSEYVVRSNITGTYINNKADHAGANIIRSISNGNLNVGGIYINNTATSTGGANVLRNVVDSNITGIYINNTAGRGGGANSFMLISNLNIGGIYINNTAPTKDIIQFYNYESHEFDAQIKNAIFLNNNCTYEISANYGGVVVKDSWFGNNASNYMNKPNINYDNVTIDNWLFLNATADYTSPSIMESSNITFKLYSTDGENVSDFDNSKLPAVNLALTATKGDVEKTTTLDKGVKYMATKYGKGSVTASIENAEYTIFLENRLNPEFSAEVNPQEIDYGNNTKIFLSYNDTATGTVNITFTGKKHNHKIENVDLNKTIQLPNTILPDEYKVTVTYSGDKVFANASATSTLTVNQLKSDIKVVGHDIYVNETTGLIFTVTLPENATGNLTISNGTTLNVTKEGKKEKNSLIIKIMNNNYPVGQYEWTFTYNGDDIYESSKETSQANILTIPTEITVNATSKLFVDNTTQISYNLTPDGAVGDIRFTSNDTSVVEVDHIGNIKAIAEGTALITVSFEGSENYTASSTNITVTVSKIPTEINITNETVELKAHQSIGDLATLNPKLAGNLTYTSNDEDIVVASDDGFIYARIKGTAIVTVSFAGDDKYKAAESKNITVTVTLNDARVSVENDTLDLFVDDTFTIVATTVPGGLNVTYMLDNSGIISVDENGLVTALKEGTVPIIVKVGGDGVYAENTTTVTVTVNKISTDISIANATVNLNVDDEVSTGAKLNPEEAGNLTYTSSDENIAIVKDGKIIALKEGDAIITVSFKGNNKYGEAKNKTIKVTVKKLNPTMNITADEITEGENATINVELPIDATGNVTTTINGKTYSSPVENGKTIISIPDLKYGNYTVPITYSGDDKYNPLTKDVNLTVKEDEIVVSAPDLTKYYSGNERFTVNVAYANGRAIAGKEVKITINGVTYKRTTDENGSALLSINLNSATYDTVVEVDNISVNSLVTILPTIDAEDVESKSKNIVFSATFRDGEGNYLKEDTDVSFNIDGVIHNSQVTGDKGRAGVDLVLDHGRYIITSYNSVSGENVSSSIAIDLKDVDMILSGDVISVGENATITVILPVDAAGNIRAEIGGKNYAGQVNVGQALITIPGLTAGNYNIHVTYSGDNNYNHATGNVSVSVAKINPSIDIDDSVITVGENATVSVTLPGDAFGNVRIGNEIVPVKNGFASAILTGLKVGITTIPVTYSGDDKYNPIETSADIVVNDKPAPDRKNLTIKANGDEITEGEDAVINVTGLESATGDVSVIIHGKTYTAPIKNGGATVTVSGITENTTAYVNYAGDKNYNPASASVKIMVNPAPKPVKKNLTLHANAEPITVGEDANVIVTGLKDATGDVSLIVNGRTYTSPIMNGGASIIVSGLKENAAGKVSYPGDDNYNDAHTTVVIIVDSLPNPGKKNLTIKADSEPITVGENATVKVTGLENATGDVSLTVDGKLYAASIRNGEATVTVSGMTENVTAYVNYVGDDNYNSASASVKITVYPAPKPVKKNLTMHANAEPITVGEDVNVIVAGLEGATGDVSLIVNGRTYSSPIKNGEVSIIVSGLKENAVGQVLYSGDDNYNNASASVVIVVNPLPVPGKKNLTIKADAEPITVGENATVKVTGLVNASGVVSVIVDGKIFTAPIRNGESTVTVSGMTENVTAYVDYVGDDNYNPASASVKITVMPKENATISIDAPDVTKYFKGPERFVVTVTDYKGNPLANKSVGIVINGVKYERTTNANGTCSIALNLPANVYNVTTTVDNATTNSVITILTTVNGTDLVKVFRNATQYYATFRNSDGKYLAEGSVVRFNINGVMYDRKVNALGLAKLNINLEAGKYIITAINTVTGEMSSNNITVISKIIENSDLTKYYRNATQYTVKIIGDDGKAVGAGESVTFNINGVFYTRQTNASGIVKLNINLQPGDYIITAEYKNCRVSNNIKVLPVLTAEDLSMKYMDGSQFKAKLVDGKGNPYPKQTVTFNINGVFYNRVTDSDGQAKLNIRLMAGEYIITSSYNGCNIANKITIRG